MQRHSRCRSSAGSSASSDHKEYTAEDHDEDEYADGRGYQIVIPDGRVCPLHDISSVQVRERHEV